MNREDGQRAAVEGSHWTQHAASTLQSRQAAPHTAALVKLDAHGDATAKEAGPTAQEGRQPWMAQRGEREQRKLWLAMPRSSDRRRRRRSCQPIAVLSPFVSQGLAQCAISSDASSLCVFAPTIFRGHTCSFAPLARPFNGISPIYSPNPC